MSVDQKTLASRLRQARETAGLTQEQVASSLSLTRTALVQMEGGARNVSSLELVRLARLYRREMADFFADELPAAEADPTLVLHRLSNALGNDPDIREEVQRCFDICRSGVELEEILDLPRRVGPPVYQLPVPRSVMDAVYQGQRVASQERARLGLGDSPIHDMSDLLNGVGVWASGVRLPDSMSGLFLSDPQFGLAILVNYDHPRARKRFSYAHEFAHALLDRDLQANASDRNNSGEPREKRANAFAAAFLMPEAGVKTLVRDLNKGQPSRTETPMFDVAGNAWADASLRTVPGSQTIGYQNIATLADHFRVSYPAAVYRLRGLNIIGPGETTDLLAQEAEAGRFMKFLNMFDAEEKEKAKKTGEPDRELVVQIAQLAIEAYRREEISRGRLLEIAHDLHCNGQDLLGFAQSLRKA